MKKFFKFIPIFALLTLSACAADQPSSQPDPLLPLPAGVREPDDSKIPAAVQAFLRQENAPPSSAYTIVREDLNGDGRREAFVLFNHPYGYWCDFYGCPVLILKANEDDFSIVNKIRRVRGALYVSEKKSHGWKDLIVHVSGRWSETKDVMLEFDGARYPDDPERLPPIQIVNKLAGRRFFYD